CLIDSVGCLDGKYLFFLLTGNVLEGGKKEKEVFTFQAPEGYGLAGVHGSCDTEIDRLGAIYLRLTTP
ncbi:MAG: hypothetical protein K2G28_04595, partial [Acetatifactor sp.]|nr:hypothetical protein [Acetatifactor sp.]